MNRMRPAVPWFLEDHIHGSADDVDCKVNPFCGMKTPAAILAYLFSELPLQVVVDVVVGVVETGSSGRANLFRDIEELKVMGYTELADILTQLLENAPVNAGSISDTEFLPESLTGADEVTLKATAAIVKLKVRERCENVSVYERMN
jgi:hypothetical protein